MLHIELPLPLFLKKALAASLSADLLGFMVLIARSADAVEFQDQLIEHWESLDDLTHEQLFFCAPKLPKSDSAFVAAGNGENRHGLESESLTLQGYCPTSWSDNFDSSEPATNLTLEALNDLYATSHFKRRDADAQRAAITASTTETAAFFGLDESMIPCLVIVAAQEHRIYAIHLPDSFSLYRFTRSLLIECGSSLTTIREMRSKIAKLDSEIAYLHRQRSWESRPRHNECRKDLPIEQWETEHSRIKAHLQYLASTAPTIRPLALELLEWFGSDGSTERGKVLEVARELLGLVRGEWTNLGIPESKVKALKHGLLHSINRGIPGMADREKSETLWDEWINRINQRVQRVSTQLAAKESEKNEAMDAIREHMTSIGFGRQIRNILARECFDSRPGGPRELKHSPNWSVSEFIQNRAPTRPLEAETKRDYDVALSYASEDRDIAEAIAAELKAKGVKVFFDKFEKYALWGTNLVDYLTEVYFSRAQFCLMLISRHYVKKAWTKLERQAMQARALESKREYILPVKLAKVRASGLLPTVGYLDFAVEGVDGIVDAVLAKCKTQRSNI